ncbi:hypothetical protein C8J37_11650 [Rhizobium sp. PP-WC-1G-195]|nr:hypothetical protein C8J37_11650 [Rhizobium sp. PP-WC-1G-195]
MKRLGQTRKEMFETMERPALATLPAEDYEYAEWKLARVSTDYHVEFEHYFYSVPHTLIRQQVDMRATTRTIEAFFRGKRVPPTNAVTAVPATEPIPIICPVRTAVTQNGLLNASSAGVHPSDLTQRG